MDAVVVRDAAAEQLSDIVGPRPTGRGFDCGDAPEIAHLSFVPWEHGVDINAVGLREFGNRRNAAIRQCKERRFWHHLPLTQKLREQTFDTGADKPERRGLQDKVLVTGVYGEWLDLGCQKQFRTDEGAVVNWWQTTGTITVQGKRAATSTLKRRVAR